MMVDVDTYEIFIELDLLENGLYVCKQSRSVRGIHFCFFLEFLGDLEAFLEKTALNVKNKNSRLYQTKVDNRYRCQKWCYCYL